MIAPADALVHEALLYADTPGFLDGSVAFLHGGFELAEPALVAVPGGHVDLLRGALGADAHRVRWVDMAVAGRNPGRIIAGVLRAFVEAHPAGRVRIIGEPIWAGRTAAEYRAALQHEALINVALAGAPASILCPYDTGALPTEWVADALTTHPVLVEDGRRAPSPDYADPGEVADGCHRPLPDPPELWGDMIVFSEPGDLRQVRAFVARLAVRGGLSTDRAEDLCAAVNEVATNTVVHTGARGVVSVWQDRTPDGAASVVVEVSDSGRLPDRLVGRRTPAPSEPSGRGLVLAHALCDLVELPTCGLFAGTTVRLHVAVEARSVPVPRESGAQ